MGKIDVLEWSSPSSLVSVSQNICCMPTLCYCVKSDSIGATEFLQDGCNLQNYYCLADLRLVRFLLGREAWQGRRDRFRGLSMDEMSWSATGLMLQAEREIWWEKTTLLLLCVMCAYVRVCVSRGFVFFSKEIEQYAIPFMGSDPSVVKRTQRFLYEEEHQSPVS